LSDMNQNKVLWIVCQPDDVGIHLVKTLQDRYNGTIVPGNDSIDALCILMHARRLVLATHSTFSQMAALLSTPNSSSALPLSQEVHYLLPTMREPEVTLVVPHWRYHLVDETTKDTIQQFDVNVSAISPVLS
jgi:type III secretory pathway component EscU